VLVPVWSAFVPVCAVWPEVEPVAPYVEPVPVLACCEDWSAEELLRLPVPLSDPEAVPLTELLLLAGEDVLPKLVLSVELVLELGAEAVLCVLWALMLVLLVVSVLELETDDELGVEEVEE